VYSVRKDTLDWSVLVDFNIVTRDPRISLRVFSWGLRRSGTDAFTVCPFSNRLSMFLQFIIVPQIRDPSSSSGQESAASRVIFALTYFLALRSTMPKGDRPHSTFSVYHCTNAIEKRRGKRKNINKTNQSEFPWI